MLVLMLNSFSLIEINSDDRNVIDNIVINRPVFSYQIQQLDDFFLI